MLILKKEQQYPGKTLQRVIPLVLMIAVFTTAAAQNPNIKCYFNHPVNTSISTGANAAYLNGKFPDTIAAYINRAKYTIDIALYNYTASSGSSVAKIATAVNAAANRGVVVRWIYNGTSSTSNTGLSLLNALVHTTPSANYTNYIMHNKFMVIDVNSADSTDVIAQTGSYNWSDFQSTGDYNNIIFFQSKQVALAFYNEFNKMWGGTAATPNTATATFSTFKTKSAQTKFNVNGTPVEVYFSPKDSLGNRLESSINTCNYDLVFGIYAFTDFSISDRIKTKYNAGINVKGVMDEFSNATTAYNNLSPVLGSNMLIFSGSDLYHNKIMLVDPLNPASDPQVFTGSFNWSAAGQFSNDENAVVVHDPVIANQYYQSLCKDFTNLGGTPCVASPCPSTTYSINASIRGTSYQWQLNTGSGFANISDNSFYSGTATANLTLTNTPTSWYGYQYRCLVNGTSYSSVTNLTFTAYWNGSVNTAWENTANWNCGVLPDANTDVIINNGVKFFPVVNANTSCRSLRLAKGSLATLINGISLMLVGH